MAGSCRIRCLQFRSSRRKMQVASSSDSTKENDPRPLYRGGSVLHQAAEDVAAADYTDRLAVLHHRQVPYSVE